MAKEYKEKEQFDGISVFGRCPTCGDEIIQVRSQNSLVYTYTCLHGGTTVIPVKVIQHTKMSKKNVANIDELVGAINSQELNATQEENLNKKEDKDILKD